MVACKHWLRGLEVEEGLLMPRLWGVSCWKGSTAVCHPIPLNLVVRYVGRFWMHVRHGRPSKLEEITHGAWLKGYRRGVADERARIRQLAEEIHSR